MPVYNPNATTTSSSTTTAFPADVPESDYTNAQQPVPGFSQAEPFVSHAIMETSGHDVAPPMSPSTSLEGALQGLIALSTSDPNAIKQVQESLIKAGYLSPNSQGFTPGAVSVDDPTYSAYAALLNDAVVSGTGFNKILAERTKEGAGKGVWAQYSKLQAGQSVTTKTSSETDLTSAPDAAAIANSESEDLLGQRVSTANAQQYQGELNAYEQANPTNETTTESQNPASGATSENTTESGGISASGAENMAQNDIIANQGKTYAQAQGAQIYNLFASLIGGE